MKTFFCKMVLVHKEKVFGCHDFAPPSGGAGSLCGPSPSQQLNIYRLNLFPQTNIKKTTKQSWEQVVNR